MFQRRSLRSAPRARSLAVGGALAALAVVGGGTVVAVSAPGTVGGEVRLTQNVGAQEMAVGTAVNLDLQPVVARAAGGTVPPGTTVQVTGLPDGLSQDGWVISGAPTRAGTYDVLVTVSNSGLTRSENVTVTVTEGAGESTTTSPAETPAAAAAGAADQASEGESTSGDDATLDGAEGTAGDDVTTPEGDATTTGDDATTSEDSTEGDDATGDDTTDPTLSESTPTTGAPDLCAVFGGGEVDGAALATGLTPLLGEAGESVPAGLLTVIVDALARMLPSVLGDTGSLGTLACGLQGGGSAGAGVDTGTGTEAGTGTATAETATTGADAGAAAATTAGPAALLGLLGTGAGSLGG